MNFIGIIPARYASTRFPGKPLAMLGGKTVVERVYEQACRALPRVCVATDDERILQVVMAFGGEAVMTSPNHRSGTDRAREAVELLGADCDVVVNIQGDEPFIAEEQIRAVCRCFDTPETQIATLAKPFGDDAEAIANPNSPKVVTDNRGYAMYFSRSVIPYLRGHEADEWPRLHTYLKHIGLYAYRLDALQTITSMPQSELEQAESLEQLRWLQGGFRIKVALTDVETIGIDTPADLERAEAFLTAQGSAH